MASDLENAIVTLIRGGRFYAEMISRMTKTSTTDIETMGVNVDLKGVHLYYNPYFLADLNPAAAGEVLKHECEHPMRGHFEREKTLAPEMFNKEKESLLDRYKNMSTAYLLNLAEDYSINETLPNLPAKFKIFKKDGTPVLDEKTGKPIEAAPALVTDLIAMFPNETVERHQAMEYYYSFLKQKKEEGAFGGQNQNGTIILPMDQHEMLEASGNDLDPQLVKAIVQRLANESMEAAGKGHTPGHMQILIDKLNHSTHDWRKDLRMFRAHCSTPQKIHTRKRRNRRYGLLYPGRKSKVDLHLVVAIDTSGSVNDKALAQFFAEIKMMYELGVKITIIECDCVVNQVYRFNPHNIPKVKGRGGTDFKPVFDLIDTNEFTNEFGDVDGLIFQTDGGDYGELAEQPNYPVLWALLPRCEVRYDWGRKTYIEVNN